MRQNDVIYTDFKFTRSKIIDQGRSKASRKDAITLVSVHAGKKYVKNYIILMRL